MPFYLSAIFSRWEIVLVCVLVCTSLRKCHFSDVFLIHYENQLRFFIFRVDFYGLFLARFEMDSMCFAILLACWGSCVFLSVWTLWFWLLAKNNLDFLLERLKLVWGIVLAIFCFIWGLRVESSRYLLKLLMPSSLLQGFLLVAYSVLVYFGCMNSFIEILCVMVLGSLNPKAN